VSRLDRNLDHLNLDWLNPEEQFGYPEIPQIDYMPWRVDYSDRGPEDYVLSGPLGNWPGHGRRFPTLSAALQWAQEKFGESQVKLLNRSTDALIDAGISNPTRWAIRVRPR
jgi:hypothetical protein